MSTVIIDYDAGNLRSVEKAVLKCGGEAAVISRDPEVILGADRIILPGVGAFGDAMQKLKDYALTEVIAEAVARQIPFLGICLGMQLLFESSEEAPGVKGLGLLPGKILRIPGTDGLKIPHMGWNSLAYPNPGRLYADVPEHSYVYFVHSYYLKASDPGIVTASAEYGVTIHASVEQDLLFGCQFHPEKSGECGLRILSSFLQL